MEEKLDLDDANRSTYVVFGSLLGSWGARCARIGCGEDGEDLACLASHLASHSASQGYPQPHTALNRPHLVANVVHLHGLTIPNITLPC